MDESTHWQLEIFQRDLAHQEEWMNRNGVIDAAKDAAKALRDSGIVDAIERADLNPIIDGFNALTNSGVVTRNRKGEASTAEPTTDSGKDSNDSPNGATTGGQKTNNQLAGKGKWLGPYKPPGRHVDPWNITAYQIFVDGNWSKESEQSAYDHWCQQSGVVNPGEREREAFTKAMSRRKDAAAYQIIVDGNWSKESEQRAFDYWCSSRRIVNPGELERNRFEKAMYEGKWCDITNKV